MKLNQTFRLDEYSTAYKYAFKNDYVIKELETDEHGRLFKIIEKPSLTEEQQLDLLRSRRNEECFPIINRGKLWYDKLTDEQIDELNSWYSHWLDITKTKVVPTKPSWLK